MSLPDEGVGENVAKARLESRGFYPKSRHYPSLLHFNATRVEHTPHCRKVSGRNKRSEGHCCMEAHRSMAGIQRAEGVFDSTAKQNTTNRDVPAFLASATCARHPLGDLATQERSPSTRSHDPSSISSYNNAIRTDPAEAQLKSLGSLEADPSSQKSGVLKAQMKVAGIARGESSTGACANTSVDRIIWRVSQEKYIGSAV